MMGLAPRPDPDAALGASWERCELKYKLARDTARPILRMQASEVAPRLEQMIERTGGRNGIFQQLAGIAAETGACLVVSDADGVLVRLEGKQGGRDLFEQKGIALGSVWDERVAGTNGVSMALSEGAAFTVRGQDHYFSLFKPFSCTAVPLFDAENKIVGAINLSMLDRGNRADYLFARQLLGEAADRVQRLLFERRFSNAMILSVAPSIGRDLLQSNELVAVNEDGIILGATARAHLLAGSEMPEKLQGQSFETVFGADTTALVQVPDRVMSVQHHGSSFDIAARLPDERRLSVRPAKPARQEAPVTPRRRRLAPSLKRLSLGCERMAAMCARAQACYRRSLPFVIEGASGTGKTSLVAALIEGGGTASQVVTVDCATLDDTPDDRAYFNTLTRQARVAGSLSGGLGESATIVFENVDEMPAFAQAGLRGVLDAFDATEGDGAPRVISTCRGALLQSVEQGLFRDDLLFLLARSVVTLPGLAERERIDVIARDLAGTLAGADVEITEEALAALRAYPWPGNLRELRNVLQQALIEGDGRRISAVELLNLTGHVALPGTASTAPTPAPAAAKYSERKMIEDALIGARWNVSQAARTLGMGRATIHRKIKQFGISRPA
ncbi:sigma-54-dependent Fis family transcriptional regulator [Mameliella sp.]|uniref:sigma-54-dependent Fis family transcriptional regulator n=1 Tax=Mameliella sp. TaxID=1924940 RepID=UPI003B509703